MSFIPKKSLSQNFLVNTGMKQKISEKMLILVEENKDFEILEIGPGKGDLTDFFLYWDREVICLEIDRRSVAFLQKKYTDQANLKLLEIDAYEEVLNPCVLKEVGDFILLSNLPFNIGSRILVEFAIHFHSKPFSVILQKDVVKKLLKTSPITFFGSWMNLFWDFEYCFDINPGNFYPKPDVVSALVTARPKKTLQWLGEYTKDSNKLLAVRAWLKKLHSFPRKNLFNNLKTLQLTKEEVTNFAKTYNYNLESRLTWESYFEILRDLSKFQALC